MAETLSSQSPSSKFSAEKSWPLMTATNAGPDPARCSPVLDLHQECGDRRSGVEGVGHGEADGHGARQSAIGFAG